MTKAAPTAAVALAIVALFTLTPAPLAAQDAPSGAPQAVAPEAPGAPAATAGEISEGALTPEIMLTEPPLTEADFQLFIALYQYMLYGPDRLNFKTFAQDNGVALRRLNYVAAKISLPLGEAERRGQRINELGLGVLLDRGEMELFAKHKPELEKLTEAMKRAIAR
ncbi:MAG: hypothetical protein LBF58_09170 [Deltaproteobacteria bacterium]|jgi:hypothetical protein|nr:hypothetical protein [Deltaproteobacteria bacterium]